MPSSSLQHKLARHTDIIVALGVVGIVAMMIVPCIHLYLMFYLYLILLVH